MLERLIQQEEKLYLNRKNGTPVFQEQRIGKMITVVVHSMVSIEQEMRQLEEINSRLIPFHANAYVASEFNADTKIIRAEKEFSVYAVQFYKIYQERIPDYR